MEKLTFAMQISLIGRVQRTRFDHRSRHTGLTLSQWRALAAIRMEPGATQHRIAIMLEVGDVTAGRTIDRLCEEGFIERRVDPNDRRVHLIHPLPHGLALFERLTEIGRDENEVALAGLVREERAELSRMLDIVMANLNKSVAECGDASNRPETAARALDNAAGTSC